MIHPPESTPGRPRSGGGRRPRADWSRPPSARTPDGPTPARSGASTSWLDGRELDDVTLAAYLAEAARRRARFLERLDGDRRGVLSREARR